MIKKLNLHDIPFVPKEIVNIIADYNDYYKYCKPSHQEKFNLVMNDIISMGKIMYFISPKIAYTCWGSGPNLIPKNPEDIHWVNNPSLNSTGMDIGYDASSDEESGWSDDEENNFGLDYDDTHYYMQGFED